MAKRRHLIVQNTATDHPYVSTQTGGGARVFRHPARDRVPHAQKLKSEIDSAATEAETRITAAGDDIEIEGIALEFIGSANDILETDKLDDRTSKIELLSVREEGDRKYGTVRVPRAKLKNFLAKIERYETETDQRRKDQGPKNKDLVESIDGVRLPVLRSFWTDVPELFPENVSRGIWWEVWLRTGSDDHDEVFAAFVVEADRIGLRLCRQVVKFPERLVFIAYGTAAVWAHSLALLGMVAELRKAKEIPTDYVGLPPRDQALVVEDGAERTTPPPEDAPAVCLLDTGASARHPLLAKVLDETDMRAVHPEWSVADEQGHGTLMAGVATFGSELAEHLAGSDTRQFQHRLESVKLLHPTVPNDPDNYGFVTTEAVAIAEAARPERDRIACLAVTSDDLDMGHPTLWSAAIDQHASGALDDERRLYVVSAGNIRELSREDYEYPRSNREQHGIEDPGQSWNALTVGACTNVAHIRSEEFDGYQPVAPAGGLSPRSRTSMMWTGRDWPFKPDVVMEGGNYATDPQGNICDCDDLRLLTTTIQPTGRLLDTMADTSAATAQTAKLGAELLAQYPTLWPETIRGLIIHSARWTDQMLNEFPGDDRDTIHRRLRCYGYGVPDRDNAFWTVGNRVSLIAQDVLRPFQKVDSTVKTKDYNIHELPWPKQVLEELGETPVTVRITLSYFIEPSPGRRGWTNKFRYASHGLRFALRGPAESDAAFLKRISRGSWSEEERGREADRPSTADPQDRWGVGKDMRTRGSAHSDWWTGTAAEVASCGKLAVFPVTGWWRERHHLGKYDRDARYALLVTIHTPEQAVDLYTPIAQQVGLVIET